MSSLRRWLKIARAEAYRDFITSVRYPLEVFTGLFILYIFFIGVYSGSKVLAGGSALSGSHDAMIVAFTMWFFAIMAINTMSVDIESEARQGTLEQVYLHAPDYLALLWVRGLIHLAYGGWVVVALSVLIQLTTRHWLPLGWAQVLPLIGIAAVGVAGLCGIGLILGALSLIFKRIGQLAAILQFGLFFLACVDLTKLPPALQAVAPHLPLIGLVRCVMLLTTPGTERIALFSAFWLLVLDSAVYAILGSLAFKWAEKRARRAGSLSHY